MVRTMDYRYAGHSAFKSFKAFVLPLLIWAAACSRVAVAQTPADPVQSSFPATQTTTLKSDVRRVEVDIVVTDRQGRPVTGLVQDDFKVQEDSAAQAVRSFDVHTVAPETSYTAPKVPELPPNTFLNVAKARELGIPTVLLYDALNTPLAQQSYGHQEILKLIKRQRPGTQIAIFILTGKLHLLQGFTDDTGLLVSALASKAGRPQTTTLLAPDSVLPSTSMSENPETTVQVQGRLGTSGGTVTGGNPDQVFVDFLDKARELDALDKEQLQDQRVELTLHALTDIGRFLSPLPGRKELIWLSSAFPVGVLPDPAMTIRPPSESGPEVHDRDMRDYSGQIKRAADLLNLSHVSVYPVDIRGLRINSDLTAASNAAYGSNPTFGGPKAGLAQSRNTARANTSTSMNLSQQTFIQEDEATRETMDSLADATGGHAFYGTNGLQDAVSQALLSGSTYYSLTYEPTNPKYDGSLRHIKVTLKKSGYTLAYRKTYYADDLTAAAHAAADAPETPLSPALERGTPLAHGLLVEAHLDPGGPPVAATPDQMRVLARYEAMRTEDQAYGRVSGRPSGRPAPPVMMQPYTISYGLVARQLAMAADSTGTRTASLEFGLLAYDEDGRKLLGLDTRVDDPLPPARYEELAAAGYRAAQTVAVPTTAALLRLAVRDRNSNRTGSLEIRLPLAQPAKPTPAPSQTPAK